jgi:hypothetical protein
VWVDALLPDRTARGVGFVSAGASGGTGASWQMFGPQDFRAGAVRASFQQLAPGEHLGVLLVNSGGRDPAIAQVDATGVAAALAPSEPPAGHTGLRMADERAPALHAPQEEIVETAAPSERVVLADHTSFCVVPGMDFSRHVRKPATRLLSTAHADFFADDEDAAHYDATFMAGLGSALEERVLPSSNAAFGPPTDVDGNGKLLVLLTHELGAHLNGGWLIGYFGNVDLAGYSWNAPRGRAEGALYLSRPAYEGQPDEVGGWRNGLRRSCSPTRRVRRTTSRARRGRLSTSVCGTSNTAGRASRSRYAPTASPPSSRARGREGQRK